MNKKIKELASHAEEYTRLEYNNAYWHIPDDMKEDLAWREKFAELVIKETMQVIANNLPSNIYLNVADAVIKHFE